jgi:hypothetical protein
LANLLGVVAFNGRAITALIGGHLHLPFMAPLAAASHPAYFYALCAVLLLLGTACAYNLHVIIKDWRQGVA